MSAAKKSTYVPAKVVRRAKYQIGEASMLVILSEGKSGFNTKATFRMEKKGDAQTGMRGTFKTQADGEKAFDKICKEVEAKGWTVASTSRNAFTEIPAPPKQKLGSQKKHDATA